MQSYTTGGENENSCVRLISCIEPFIMDNFIQHIAKRAREMHSAKICRICLQEKDLVHIAENHRLFWCFSQMLPSDDEFPQFVCAVCQQLIDVFYQFSVLGNLTANLIRSYVKDGKNYPRTEIIEDELHRAEKCLEHSGRESVGKRSEMIQNDTVEKGCGKQPQQTDKIVQIPKTKPAIKKSKNYMKSDEFLFGDIVDLKQLSKEGKIASEKTCTKQHQPRALTSSLKHQDNKENIPPISAQVKTMNPPSTSLVASSKERCRSLSHRENLVSIKGNETGLQFRGKVRHASSKVYDKR